MSADRSLHILLADDEQIVLHTFATFLEHFGHRVDTAVDGLEGLQAIEQTEYDVALLDVRMPGLDGLSLLARARDLRPNMPVVIITGHGDPDMEEEARKLGAAEFLTKPVSLRDLVDLLGQIAP